MLNGRLFLDRHLVVDKARPQPQRGRGGLGPPTSGALPWNRARELLFRAVPPANRLGARKPARRTRHPEP